jgi:hypothetical protein
MRKIRIALRWALPSLALAVMVTVVLQVLLCFGCWEVYAFGPNIESKNDLNDAAGRQLQDVLSHYQQNRPSRDSNSSPFGSKSD